MINDARVAAHGDDADDYGILVILNELGLLEQLIFGVVNQARSQAALALFGVGLERGDLRPVELGLPCLRPLVRPARTLTEAEGCGPP